MESVVENSKNKKDDYEKKFGDEFLPGVIFDEDESRRWVAFLESACLKFGIPTYFFTQTCNPESFPGFPKFSAILKKFELRIEDYLVFFTRLWHRNCNLLINFLTNGKEKYLGTVKHTWGRFEFQSKRGNFAHLHLLVWNTDRDLGFDSKNSEGLEAALSRITATIDGSFDFLKMDDYEKECFIEDVTRWQTHCCGDWCQTVSSSDSNETECRYKFPMDLHRDENDIQRIHVKIDADLIGFFLIFLDDLIDAGEISRTPRLGFIQYEHENEKLFIKPYLCGTKYDPPRGRNCQFIVPFSARISALTKSHHNVVVCDEHFTVSYLLKYTAGAEERSLANITRCKEFEFLLLYIFFRKSCEVTIRDEFLRKRKRKRPQDRYDGYLISSAEMIFHLLMLDVVVSSIDFVHLSLAPPENRYHFIMVILF